MYRQKSKERGRKVTPPSPSYMSNDQFAAYLADLRSNRVARPGGARPQPASSGTKARDTRTSRIAIETGSMPTPADDMPEPLLLSHSSSANTPTSFPSVSSRQSVISAPNKDFSRPGPDLKPSDVVPTATYMERGQRWMEREEVGSLRQAMNHMGLGDPHPPDHESEEDQRIYHAALGEASELVWQHRNGNGREPDQHAPYRYKPHMRKNSYQQARTASIGNRSGNVAIAGLAGDSASATVRGSMDSNDGSRRSRNSLDRGPSRGASLTSSSAGGIRGDRNSPTVLHDKRRSSMKRNISGEARQSFSGDQIWEEPEIQAETSPSVSQATEHTATPLIDMPRNPQGHGRIFPEKPYAGPVSHLKIRSTVDIHRNPPSQSRNPQYTTNLPSTRASGVDTVPRKNGVEIRGDDIRDATTMRLKDRSAKLPTPSAVSDNPGRPIVSFDANWNPPEVTTDQESGSARRGTSTRELHQKNQAIVIPTIVVPEDDELAQEKFGGQPALPSIIVDESADEGFTSGPSIPVIVTPDNSQRSPDAIAKAPLPRPLPIPSAGSARKAQNGGHRGHWSPAPAATPRSGTSCHECGFSIEGRFVALAGGSQRFHPGCFSCYACGTSLEALEISPEPETARNERLDRIRRRAQGELLEDVPGKSTAEDGDERLRFYCHLDWHELFAPKCKHCKTPILGEHIVALGEHWHYGHFFCAECGDPFQQGMTHIEKDGYAWCINCQTKRTERRAPKCKMCGLAVIGQYLQALGGEWHETCFRCGHCHGSFEDGQVFPKEEQGKMIVLCTGCRMRELKA